jgi:hypothetical protein
MRSWGEREEIKSQVERFLEPDTRGALRRNRLKIPSPAGNNAGNKK